MNRPIALRPHHLTCLFFYVGHGYSPAFTARMDELSTRVRDPAERLVLVRGCDDDLACAACPHRTATGCETEARVAAFDARTLAEFGLEIGVPCEAPSLFAAMFGRFDAARFERICGDCEWRQRGVCDPAHPPRWP